MELPKASRLCLITFFCSVMLLPCKTRKASFDEGELYGGCCGGNCGGYVGGKSAMEHADEGLFDSAAYVEWSRGIKLNTYIFVYTLKCTFVRV